jgi:hypothetical protein
MRIRLIVATIAGLLFCTLAALEFPELVNLTDDTSNDYSLAIFPRSEGAAVQKQIADFPAGSTATNRRLERLSCEFDFRPHRMGPLIPFTCFVSSGRSATSQAVLL